MIVKKAVKMAEMMRIPILGVIENMSYVLCPKCGEKHSLFGESRVAATVEEMGLRYLGSLPLDSKLVSLCDAGKVEEYSSDTDGIFTKWLTD